MPLVIAQSTSYHYLGSSAVASVDETGSVNYLYHDRLGTDTSTNTLPFGQVIVEGDRFGYTGKEQDQETGLYYYGARYYEPDIGRFMAADKVKGRINYPQSLNRYS